MKEFAVYTAARLGIFLVAYAAVVGVYLLVSGADRIPVLWPFLLAVVVSAVASAVLLRKQRDAFAMAVHRRAERAARRPGQETSGSGATEQAPGGRTDSQPPRAEGDAEG